MIVNRASGRKHAQCKVGEDALLSGFPEKTVAEKFVCHIQIDHNVIGPQIELAAHHIQVKDTDVSSAERDGGSVNDIVTMSGINIVDIDVGMHVIRDIREAGILSDVNLIHGQRRQLKAQDFPSVYVSSFHIAVAGTWRTGVVNIELFSWGNLS